MRRKKDEGIRECTGDDSDELFRAGAVGENGAGKSTLIKIISGAESRSSGEILVNGSPEDIRSPKDAERLGISTVYQEFNLVPALSVAENIFLGDEPLKNCMHYESLNSLPEVRISAAVSSKFTVVGEIGKGNHQYIITLSNNGAAPAVQTRIHTLSSTTHTDILPAFYSDNYFVLMPGESRTVTVEFNPRYLQGGQPVFELSGWTTKTETIGGMENRK